MTAHLTLVKNEPPPAFCFTCNNTGAFVNSETAGICHCDEGEKLFDWLVARIEEEIGESPWLNESPDGGVA